MRPGVRGGSGRDGGFGGRPSSRFGVLGLAPAGGAAEKAAPAAGVTQVVDLKALAAGVETVLAKPRGERTEADDALVRQLVEAAKQ